MVSFKAPDPWIGLLYMLYLPLFKEGVWDTFCEGNGAYGMISGTVMFKSIFVLLENGSFSGQYPVSWYFKQKIEETHTKV